jgi:transposase-like protein
VAAAKHGRGPVSGAKTAQELENEIATLRKELAEVKQEKEILKKAAAYFAKESQQGTRHEALERGLSYQSDEPRVGCFTQWILRLAHS